MLGMKAIIVVFAFAASGVAVSVTDGANIDIMQRSDSADGGMCMMQFIPQTSAQAVDMSVSHSSQISEQCFNALSSVDEELRQLQAGSNETLEEFDWSALLSPFQVAVEHLKDSAVDAGIFLIKEFHFQMEKQGSAFGCQPPANSSESAGLKPDAMDQLRTLVDGLGVNCPKTVLSGETLSQMQDLVTLQTVVYQCAQSRSSPSMSKAERRRAMLSSSLTVPGNSSQEALYQLDTEQKELWDSHRSICEREHRLDYLDAIAPGSKRIFKDHGLCQGSSTMSQLVQTHEGMVEHLEKVSNALSNRKDGTMAESSNASIHPSNVAEHPMGPKIKGIWEKWLGLESSTLGWETKI